MSDFTPVNLGQVLLEGGGEVGGGMRILVACESSGAVREAFRALGHEAQSCDLLPADDGSIFHLQSDVLGILGQGWGLMIAHPPCDHLCVSGAR